jgi:hypothetical protein
VRIAQYMPGFLQRRYRLPSTTLVYDLLYRLRCAHCRADRGFEIVVGTCAIWGITRSQNQSGSSCRDSETA